MSLLWWNCPLWAQEELFLQLDLQVSHAQQQNRSMLCVICKHARDVHEGQWEARVWVWVWV